jgi:hypothetical protein
VRREGVDGFQVSERARASSIEKLNDGAKGMHFPHTRHPVGFIVFQSMNDAAPSTPPGNRQWWCVLIATMIAGPFLPYLCMIGFGKFNGREDLEAMLLGTAIWFLIVIVVTIITGWRVTGGHRTGARVGLTFLFTIAACAVGLGLGIAECSAAESLWPNFLR